MDERRTSSPRSRHSHWAGLVALGTALACSPPDERLQLPLGPFIAGDARALERILDSFERLEATPLAREAREARAALAGCDEFAAGSDGSRGRLFEAEVCLSEPLSPGLVELRGDASLVFVWPLGERGGAAGPDREVSEPRVIGRVHLDESGAVQIEARVEPMPTASWMSMFVPAHEPPGPPRLGSRDALVRGRLRPQAGLDLARLFPAGSQADSMFRLRNELFLGAVLGEAWEFAIYLPRPGASMPPMALAFEVSSPTLAASGVRSFVSELEATWPVHAREAQWRRESMVPGACFYELRIMPDFAPCYAITESLLVFGWNPESVELALPKARTSEAGTWEGPAALTRSGSSGLVVHLDRFAEADARLRSPAQARGSGIVETSAAVPLASPPDGPVAPFPFSKLEIEAFLAPDSVELRVHLTPAEMQ